MIKNKIISLIGGSGFIGSYLTKELVKQGAIVKIISRNPNSSLFLRTLGNVGHISFQAADITKYDSIREAIEGSWAVINLVGIMFPSVSNSFEKVQLNGAINIAKACEEAKIEKLVHISALNCQESSEKSLYAKTKFEAEQEIAKLFPSATIIRPSIVFGHNDNFFNKFAKIISILPFVPVVNSKVRFQPVYVGDVVTAIISSLTDKNLQGAIIEAAGPEILDFEYIVRFVMKSIHKKKMIINIPISIAYIMAIFFELLPFKILTRDQVKLLNFDNILKNQNGVITLNDLKIVPKKISEIVPNYLKFYRQY